MIDKYYTFFLCIANTGIMTKQVAYKNFSISKKTFYTLLNRNFIVHKGNFIIYGKLVAIYSLSNTTKDYIISLGKSPYRSDISQLEHDYLLLKAYASLPINIQQTWLNETELKSLYTGTTVDSVFLSNKELYGIEVITPYYSQKTIAEKMKFADLNCKELIIMNTNDIALK